MPKTNTTVVINNRQTLLKDILTDAKNNGVPLSINDAIKLMKARGFHDYNSRLYFRDKVIVNKTSSYVVDLCRSNYSAYLENIDFQLSFIEAEALNLYNKTWNQNKTIEKSVVIEGNITPVVEVHTTSDIAAPKLKALEIMRDIQKLKLEMTNGDNLSLSAALLGQRYHEMEDEIIALRALVPKSKQGIIKKLEDKTHG